MKYEHKDSLNQPIAIGQPIAFTSSYLKGVKVGIVRQLTKQRVRIHFKYTYRNKLGEERKASYDTLIDPQRTIQLGDELSPTITMFLLKNGN
jgi:hypothetical protein